MKTGVCYYPEHWPAERWAKDAAHMQRIGLSHVRIGEFAWSRLEKADGQLSLHWLKDAIQVLHEHDLKVVLGTPTATPPRWMLDRYPDMLARDENLQIRDFGSRRHYCFSHEGYLNECKRIVQVLAKTFGNHPAVVAWQTDNEYGCHSTSISYSDSALHAFRQWCARQYSNIDSLNKAWGNVFWSMEYDDFEQIGLPVSTVTESNPAHQIAFWQFSSDQIKRFNKAQVDIIRQHSPGRDVLHNFMGNFVEFDHHLVSEDLDVATWDSYPLGFLTRDNLNKEDQENYLRTGHPDGAAFHHDLYRGCCAGRWWVMEQQPGPVNWAPYNPAPLPGMVKLWGWEAFAHGAEVMSYFRWRQAPFAQEQTHTGLLLSNGDEDIAAMEVTQLNAELKALPDSDNLKVVSDVAIVFSYSGVAIQDIQRPGGASHSALNFCQKLYSACRRLGLNIDIVSPEARLDQYKLILVCTSTEDDLLFAEKLSNCLNSNGSAKTQSPIIVLFAGSGSRTSNYTIPDTLPPGALQALINVQVVRCESLPPWHQIPATDENGQYAVCYRQREQINSSLEPKARFADGWGFHYHSNGVHYINAQPDDQSLFKLVENFTHEAQLLTADLGSKLRTQKIGKYRVAFNYGKESVNLDSHLGERFGLGETTPLLIGERILGCAESAVWVVP